MKKIISLILVIMMSVFSVPINASENINTNNVIIKDNFSEVMKQPYIINQNGNLVTEMDVSVDSVEVVYDGAWYGMRAANVPRVINVTVTCKGTGILGDSMYNCKLYVALELKYNSDTMRITSVGKPDVYQYSAPGAPQNSSNPRATASITNSGKSVTIYGYINYSASIHSQIFTGSTTYYL